VEERGEHVLRLNVRIVVPHCRALGVGEGLLELGREFVKTHELSFSPDKVDMGHQPGFSSANFDRSFMGLPCI
jgi:hypothetical protein